MSFLTQYVVLRKQLILSFLSRRKFCVNQSSPCFNLFVSDEVKLTSMMISHPTTPPHETCQRAMPFYLGATGMTLRLPYILKWSRSELGLSLHPLEQTTLWLFLLMCTNNLIGQRQAIRRFANNMDSFLPSCRNRQALFKLSLRLIKTNWLPVFFDFNLLVLTGVIRAPHRSM